ncbi:hypothetical protein NDU88_003811 [Pleurodeles waltl]|uniref:Reverse transcriptase domain-containing protein n=1 Tax=Pleurodeles waltl TaxID=8319 RepID=A0AAV7SH29_PLEWA|nr:hypothetical protein NDU88_003811 [Pleurodeles waltl]
MANIVVFLKKWKAPQNPASYRPITLINSDAKLYSKILAARLSLVIRKLVTPQQHGFVPGRDTAEHIQRLIALFDATGVAEEPMAVALLDAEKAFDQVRDFLSRKTGGSQGFKSNQLLEHILGESNLTIKVIYSLLMAEQLDDLEKHSERWSGKLADGSVNFFN